MLTVKEIAERTGRSYGAVAVLLRRRNIAPAETHGRMKLYSDEALELAEKSKTLPPALTAEQRKERHREAVRKWDRKTGRSGFWKVSVLDAYGSWCVRACSLSRADAYGIARGLRVRAGNHGAREAPLLRTEEEARKGMTQQTA